MGRQSVYVVGPDNKVAAREVKATTWTGNDWLIESGLAAGDRVVVDGVQKIGPGAPVHPTPYVDSASTARADSGAKAPGAATAGTATAGTATATPSAPVKGAAR
jgi:membrane fusion protein, multidrug efflux system